MREMLDAAQPQEPANRATILELQRLARGVGTLARVQIATSRRDKQPTADVHRAPRT